MLERYEPDSAAAAPGRRAAGRFSVRLWLPGLVLASLVAAAMGAPWLAPQNPYDLTQLRLEDGGRPPAWLERNPPPGAPRYWLGTDRQGRDMLSAVLYGLRVSLMVGVGATALAAVLGIGAGLAAGFWRGRLDAVIMRLADIQLSFPSVLIALFLMAVWGRGLGKIIVAVAIAHWVIYARTVRGQVLAEREKDYIAAARVLGARAPRILVRHLLPNLAGGLGVIAAVEFASVVMLEATLSFLGLGVPITRPSLGLLIWEGFNEWLRGAWWIGLTPALALAALVLSINWLVDRWRDAAGATL